MKKYISIVLAVIIVASTAFCAYAASLKGDANNDGEVNSLDARTILQISVGIKSCTESEKKKIDMNNDGNITAIDARKVLQTAAGLIEEEEFVTTPGVQVGDGNQDGQIDWDDIVPVR